MDEKAIPLTDTDLQEIEARTKAATPWWWDRTDIPRLLAEVRRLRETQDAIHSSLEAAVDALGPHFTHYLDESIKRLVAENERLKAQNASLMARVGTLSLLPHNKPPTVIVTEYGKVE